MTKQELKAAMITKGVLNTSGSRDELWVEAFKQYNVTQNPKLQMSSCGTCYNMVRQWLNS